MEVQGYGGIINYAERFEGDVVSKIGGRVVVDPDLAIVVVGAGGGWRMEGALAVLLNDVFLQSAGRSC